MKCPECGGELIVTVRHDRCSSCDYFVYYEEA